MENEEIKITISEKAVYQTATILFGDAKVVVEVKDDVPITLQVSYPNVSNKSGVVVHLDNHAMQDALKALNLYAEAVIDLGKKII